MVIFAFEIYLITNMKLLVHIFIEDGDVDDDVG